MKFHQNIFNVLISERIELRCPKINIQIKRVDPITNELFINKQIDSAAPVDDMFAVPSIHLVFCLLYGVNQRCSRN